VRLFLQALEDDVHDIQRAGMFMAAGGVRKVLGLVGNVEQDAEVRLKAAKVLGSAVQRCGARQNGWMFGCARVTDLLFVGSDVQQSGPSVACHGRGCAGHAY
jgi:hypothetical protein